MFRIPLLSLAGVVALAVSAPAYSKTYYVDSSSGNDAWSGELASPSGNNGPWLTLSKVSAHSLLPGDTVLLKCGHSWNHTLSIKASGTVASPIVFGAYPTSCTSPPQINGATAIPASNWNVHSGKIYKATLPLNLVSNSGFNTTYSGWTKWSQYNDASLSLSSSCPSGTGNCLNFTAGTGTGASIASSNQFALTAGTAYKFTAAVKVPAGKTIRVNLRRAGPPWDKLGLATSISGNGAWQTYAFPFNASGSLSNARLDFEVPATAAIGLDNVRVETVLGGGHGVFDNGRAINVAHHPNRGYNPLRPDSLYYSNAQDSAQVVVAGKNVSTYLTTGTDFQLPVGAMLTSGTEIRIRSYDWMIDERKVASVSGSRINLDQPSSYPLFKDWGYFLVGKLWMLDKPGESFFDAATNTVYVWMADGNAPGTRVSIGQIDVGIDVSKVSHVVVNGIAIRGTKTGIRLNQANNVKLSDMVVEDVLGMGIDAFQSTNVEIGASRFSRTGKAAISGAPYSLSNFIVHDNDISESGVRLNGNAVTSLPASILAAVQAGPGATVTRNSIRGVSYAGVIPSENSTVSDNHIENALLVLDDGGAIYVSGQNNNSIIQNNTVRRVVGSPAGKPATHYTLAEGIYLDSLTTGVTITGNTVVDAYDGIMLHNAANNRIENNTLYGNRRYQLWLQEQSNVARYAGDVYNNVVNGNRFFQTNSIPPVRQETVYDNTEAAASYDQNLYFTLVVPDVAVETSSTGGISHSFPKWQSLTTNSGTPRYLDPLGSEVNSRTVGYAAYRVNGSNIVPNGSLANGKTGWASWNKTAPYGTLNVVSCLPGTCLRYVAGASVGTVSTPNFSVVQGQWYRLSFDLQGSTANQTFSAVMRRGGPASVGYENLMTPGTSIATTNWQRYSIVFQSSKTINAKDPVTGDNGARVDWDGTKPGTSITVANVELIPISPVEASVHTDILVNTTNVPASFDCPFTGADATKCSQVVRFTDAQPVLWPYVLGAHDSEIIYSLDSSLSDADGDGIPTTQDTCAATPAGQSVNAKGCGFTQSYP